MARPTTKTDLMEAANLNYTKLLELINSMNEEVQTKEFHFDDATLGKEAHWKRDKNIKKLHTKHQKKCLKKVIRKL